MDFLLDLNWLAVGQIILIDILLGGDNAIVIALACRNLPPHLRTRGMVWGTVGAIVARIVLIGFAVSLLNLSYIKLVGGIVLFWIGVKLLASDDDSHAEVAASARLLTAIRTVIVADLVMSVDNVIAVAATAQMAGGRYQLALVVFGILISIPMIVWGSAMILKLMQHLPWIVDAGAALLGYVAGEMAFSDLALRPWMDAQLPQHQYAVPGSDLYLSVPGLVAAAAVLIVGRSIKKRDNKSINR
jgi:YjbE family integral membrane protein